MAPPRVEAPRPLVQGARLGDKYRLVRRIAVGGMGEVWRARNEATGADVALKVSRRSDAGDLDVRFRTEAKLGSMVSHRSIVRIFDLVEEDDGSLVLVMELLRGESLAQHIKAQGKLSTREAVAIAVPLLSGLHHVHAEGIVHRDVTPANVFLAVDPDGQVTPKLIDFGIAKLPAAGNHTLDGRVLGTPRYMAPEQIRGQPIDGRADLFSLAVVLYEAISGVSPFDAGSASASLAAVLETKVDPDPSIEPRVWLELERALGKRPYERHATAGDMADALRAAGGETHESLASLLRRAPPSRSETDAAEEHAPPSRSTVEGQSIDSHLARRRPVWAVWIAAAAIAAGLAGLTMAALRRSSSDDAPSRPSVAASAPVVEPPPPSAPPVRASTSAPMLAASAAATPPAQLAPVTRPVPKPSVRPARPPRPKPIGTMPGF